MASKQYTKINELLERARIEGDWANVSQYAQALPNEQATLRFVSLAECMLERTLNSRETAGRFSYDSLHLTKDYLNKALAHKDKTNQSYKEAILLQAKTLYVQGKFQECLDVLDQVDLDSMKKECLSFNVSRALADAYVYKGMAMEQLRELLSASIEIEGIIECYESAADLGLALMGSTTRSTFNLTLSGVLEMALIRSILLQMKHGQVEKGLLRLRKVFQQADVHGLDGLRVNLSITLGQVLLQGIPDTAWPQLVSRESPGGTDTLTKGTKGRVTPVHKKYESVFCPCNRAEEALLVLLIGQVLLYKEGCVSLHEEDETMYRQTIKQTHALLNLMVLLMGRFGQYRPLADALEKFLKFSHEDLHICRQFGLALISSGQYARGVAVLEKCHAAEVDIPTALTIAKTYINQLQRYEEAISLCKATLPHREGSPLRSRLYLCKGVAEAALTRSSRQPSLVNSYSKAAVESLHKAYSLDPNCPHILYHLALRLASVGEIRKSVRFARKVAESPGVVAMVDVAHLLALLLSAQHHSEEALSIVGLYLHDYPDNLNLLITRVLLERVVEGPTKALLTCKEVLIPLIERLGTVREDQTCLPYSDQWTSGKFQLTQWSDRVSTHTTASFSGSTMGTLPAESISESIDSAVGCDQSNWGYQAEVWYTIADIFLSDGMLPDAQKCVDEVRQLFPLSHLVSYMNGRIREAEGLKEEAEQQYINSVTLSPRHVASLVALGRLQIDLEKPLLAEHYLTEATKVKPDEFEAWHYLGELHQGQSAHQQATECFLTALRFECSAPVRPYSVLQWKI